MKIFVSETYDRSRIYFKFDIFDVYNASFYKSYIFTTTTIEIDELIMMIINNNVSYNAKIPENIANEFCRGANIVYDLKHIQHSQKIICKTNTTEGIKSQINFQTIDKPLEFIKTYINDLKIISEYHKGNPDHSYCSEFYLISINNKHFNKYFEFSIKSITFDIESNNNFFSNTYVTELDKIINIEPYIRTDKELYYIGELPAQLEIRIKEVNENYQMIYYDYYYETAEEYNNKFKQIIKKNKPFNFYIITRLYYINKHNGKNSRFCEIIENNNYLKTMYSSCFIYDIDHEFVIFDADELYYISYLPKDLILVEKYIDEFCNELNKRQTNDEIQNWDITKYSNFDELYNDDKFKHNIRHFTNEDKKNVYNLIIKYFTTKNVPYLEGNILCLAHYRNSLQDNMLHLFVYSTEHKYSRITRDVNLRDVEIGSARSILIKFDIDQNFLNKDILVCNSVKIKLGEYLKMDQNQKRKKSIENFDTVYGITFNDSESKSRYEIY